MSNNKIELIVEAKTGQAAAQIQTFGGSVQRTFSTIGRHVEFLSQKIGVFGTALTALSTGVVLKKLFSVKDFMPIDEALLRMQANFGMTAREIDGFKKSLAGMAGGLGEDMDVLFNKAKEMSIVYKPEDILKITEASSLATHALGQDLDGVTERIVQLMKIYRKTPDDAKAIAESLGASNLNAETLGVALERATLQGGAKKDYKEVIGFFAGLTKAGIGSTRMIVRYEGAISALFEKSGKLRNVGINPVGKGPLQILEELGKKLPKLEKKYGAIKLSKSMDETFGPGAHEGIAYLYAQLDKLKKAEEDQGNAAQITAKKVAAAEETWGEQLERIKGHIAAIKTDYREIYDLAKKPWKFAAEHEKLTKGAALGTAGLALAIGGGLLATKGLDLIKGLKGLGSTAVGLAEGKAIQAATGVTPVFVTNWPGAGPLLTNPMTNPMGDTAAGGIAGGLAGAGGKWGKTFGWGAAALGTGIAAFTITSAILNVTGLDKTIEKGGGNAYDWMDRHMGKGFMNVMDKLLGVDGGAARKEPEIKNNIPMNIAIYPDSNRAIVTNQGMNTQTLITLNRGNHGQ